MSFAFWYIDEERLLLPPREKNLNESSVGKGKFRSLLYCSSELSGLRIEYKALELVSTRVLGERYFISKKPFDRLKLKNPSFCDQFAKACFWSFDICLPRAFSIWFLRLAPVASRGPRIFLYSPENEIYHFNKKIVSAHQYLCWLKYWSPLRSWGQLLLGCCPLVSFVCAVWDLLALLLWSPAALANCAEDAPLGKSKDDLICW